MVLLRVAFPHASVLSACVHVPSATVVTFKVKRERFPLAPLEYLPLCDWLKIGLCGGVKTFDAENCYGAASVATATYL